MRYFEIMTCNLKETDLCMIEHAPNQVRGVDFKLAKGRRISDAYPTDPDEACVYMQKEWAGSGLGAVVSNTGSFLIAISSIREAILAIDGKIDDIEFLPVGIRDHKGRLASSDYWFINPIGRVDCVDHGASELSKTEDGSVASVKKIALDSARIDKRKSIFRITEDPYRYIIRHDLLMAIKDLNLPIPNIYVDELEVTGDAP